MKVEQTEDIPLEKGPLAEFLLPKILQQATDVKVMAKVMKWVVTSPSAPSQ
jgi:hypothetical protein